MDYKRFDNTIVLRLDRNEEICQSLLALAETEDIQVAEITGLGAVSDLSTGVYDVMNKCYHVNDFSGMYEVVSLMGTITRKDGRPYLHAHIGAGDEKGRVVGGHLNSATVSAVVEIVINLIPGEVGRKYDEKTGMNLMWFRE